MTCPECKDKGYATRAIRKVWVPLEVNIGDIIHEEQELIEIGGLDACMTCTRAAEAGYRDWNKN